MNEILVFCTCAKNNKEHYLNNIKYWRDQLLNNFNNIDLKVFSDGQIQQKIQNVQIIGFQPVFGRDWKKGTFAGWKRSFIQACKYYLNSEYKYFVHIQNDVKFNNVYKLDSIKNIRRYLTMQGLYISQCNQHCFLQSAFMILNDRQFLKQMIQFYDQNKILTQTACFQVSKLKSGNWNKVFQSVRVECDRYTKTANANKQKYDFFCQWNWENPQIV